MQHRQHPDAHGQTDGYWHSAIDVERVSRFLNQYPDAWHVIRGTLGRHEALRLAHLRRNRVITTLGVKHRWSLQAIADVFGLSRERVRQLTPPIEGHGSTPGLDNGQPSDPEEIRTDLKDAFREVVRTPQAWNGRGQVSKAWVIQHLGYDPDLPDLDFRRLSESKAEFLLRHGLGLETEDEMRAWFEEMYFQRHMTYAEIARWLSQRFVPVAPMTVHRTATDVLGVEGYGRGQRADR